MTYMTLALLASAFAGAACSQAKSAEAPVIPPTLSGQYEATGAGALAEISFPDGTHYALWRSTCAGDSATCLERGTYTFNGSNDSLVLTNGATGEVSSIAFQAQAEPADQSVRLLGSSLGATDGGTPSLGAGNGGVALTNGSDGGIALTATSRPVLTFLLGGQSFSSTDPGSAPPLFPDAGPGRCKYPIVLEHGFAASNEPSSPWQFAGVPADLMAEGHALVVADEVQPFGDVVSRAATMAQTIARVAQQCATTPGCNPNGVHVIAHSYGGLHSREYLLEHPPANATSDHLPKVISLTTISTPNAGTNLADVGVAAISAGGRVANQAVNALAGLIGSTFTSTELATDANVKSALQTLSEANAPAFAAAHPAVAGVSYFAWAGVSLDPNYFAHPIHPEQVTGAFPSDCEGRVFANLGPRGTVHDSETSLVLIPAHEITGHLKGDPNDGMATIISAKALPGSTFRGCIPADHLAETGSTTASTTHWTGFDHTLFYRVVAAGLAELETQ